MTTQEVRHWCESIKDGLNMVYKVDSLWQMPTLCAAPDNLVVQITFCPFCGERLADKDDAIKRTEELVEKVLSQVLDIDSRSGLDDEVLSKLEEVVGGLRPRRVQITILETKDLRNQSGA